MYSGVESGWFYKFDPFKTSGWNGYQTPDIIAERLLLGDPGDASAHGGNLVLEASPSLLDDVIYISSGSGHVYGMRRSDLKVVWDYRTGSDLDGTPVPTSAGKLLVPVEKQYIGGHGGILMLDPSKDPAQSVVWFFPTADRSVGDWEGGVIGSVAVNDAYDPWGRRPRLAAFIAIDGNLYVVSQNRTSGSSPGPNGDGPYPTPRVVAEFDVGGGIGSPIMVDDSIVAAGYDNKVHLYGSSTSRPRRAPPEPSRAPAATGSRSPSRRRTRSAAAAPSRARRSCGTARCSSARATARSTASATTEARRAPAGHPAGQPRGRTMLQ